MQSCGHALCVWDERSQRSPEMRCAAVQHCDCVRCLLRRHLPPARPCAEVWLLLTDAVHCACARLAARATALAARAATADKLRARTAGLLRDDGRRGLPFNQAPENASAPLLNMSNNARVLAPTQLRCVALRLMAWRVLVSSTCWLGALSLSCMLLLQLHDAGLLLHSA